MSVINAGRVQPQHKATWNSATSYIKTDIVLYNGNGYWCIQDNVNKVPNTETSYWSLMVQRGSDADLTQLENSVIYKTGDQAITGGLELTKGVFSSGFDQTSLPSDKNGTSTYWDTTSPIGGITGGIGRVASFIKSGGNIVYKALGIGPYVSNLFALLINSDGSAKFANGLDINSKKITSVANPEASSDASNKGYVDAKTARCKIVASHAISNTAGTGSQVINFPVGRFTYAPTAIRMRFVLSGYPQFFSEGAMDQYSQSCIYRIATGPNIGETYAFTNSMAVISNAISNAFYVNISAVSATSMTLNWERVNEGLTGTVTMHIEVEA